MKIYLIKTISGILIGSLVWTVLMVVREWLIRRKAVSLPKAELPKPPAAPAEDRPMAGNG